MESYTINWKFVILLGKKKKNKNVTLNIFLKFKKLLDTSLN